MPQFPPSQFYGKAGNNDSIKNFQKSPFTRMYPPPNIRPGMPPSMSGAHQSQPQHQVRSPQQMNPPTTQFEQKDAAFERFSMNPSPEVFVPGHRKRPSTPGQYFKFRSIMSII